ncbi:u6 snRNA-associated sm-like protein lsm4 [Anaeramoeba ignava]|uniref:U6 snRNA-associated Sm-like protein LSm4 n=1 Tax=Anaeramoeba ignava TaxID=1746090 RepID=A0A9Q0LSH1_ANAIG|nr:u6 snRNA-associated sm-like protein lsm4 [Anaeramoeba ignava]
MLPLSILRTTIGFPIQIQIKTGEAYNGKLSNCDNRMNLLLEEVICTSKDGDRFWKMKEVYIRGSALRDIRIQKEALEHISRRDYAKRRKNRPMQNPREKTNRKVYTRKKDRNDDSKKKNQN